MIRLQIARILAAIADRIEPTRPAPAVVQHVYVHNTTPPTYQPVTTPQWTWHWPPTITGTSGGGS